MNKAQAILRTMFGTDGWVIREPPDGIRKECYVATRGRQSVFLKFDVEVDALKRLGELHVAPHVIAHGHSGARGYVVQEYIAGAPPDRHWIRGHIKEVGSLIQTYHSDTLLKDLLERAGPPDHDTSIGPELDLLRQRFECPEVLTLFDRSVVQAYKRFLSIADTLMPAETVPVHDEPNTSNMLVEDDRLVFVDWDDVRIADPMRDLGPFLWWYLPEHAWEIIMETQNLDFTEEARLKVYWYAARASLDIVLWHIEHGYADDNGFLRDFVSAIRFGPNPRT